MRIEPPLVYCETNWLVALAFPHDHRFEAATKLRKAAAAGACRLRVPCAALLEARGRITGVGKEVEKDWVTLRDQINCAARQGENDLADIARALDDAKAAFSKYAQRRVLDVLDEVASEPTVGWLAAPAPEIALLQELRPKIRFSGKDAVDLYFLAAIIADRRAEPDGTAIFFSDNKKEFDPANGKVPAELYAAEKLLWWREFKLQEASARWARLFSD